MAARKPSDTAASQSKISFAPKRSRRSLASEQAHAAHKKTGVIIDQPRLRQRKAKELAAQQPDNKTLSQQDIDSIINGSDSEQLLKEMYKDRLKIPRFHQEDLTTGDKVLRFFDIMTAYGPAMGLTRLERWNRAHRYGKQPPQQVKLILEAAQKTDEYKSRYENSIFGALH